tara:strand:+ start:72 stop:869 length:798 start_codon:yes stop_codon:yes gene_type:complete
MIEINSIYNEDCLLTMEKIDSESVDMVLTSPPYDGLRAYNGFSFDFESIARELSRVLKPNGVIIWVVGDSVIDGSETGTSFKQALFFRELGLRMHDTMIYLKNGAPFPDKSRYQNIFEYIFCFSKGKPKTFNPILEKTNPLYHKKFNSSTSRGKDGETKKFKYEINKPTKIHGNVFRYDAGFMRSSNEKIAFEHPATFPEKLAYDQINSWSNENDVVYDPFMGSGTTAKIAIMLKRNYIGSEISKEYYDLINRRINNFNSQPYLF